MNYLAPIIILAALISTVFLFSPASAHAGQMPGLVRVLPNGEDVVLKDDINDAMFNLPLEKPVLTVMARPSGNEFEFITLTRGFFGPNSFS